MPFHSLLGVMAFFAPVAASAEVISLPCAIPAPANFALTHDQNGWASDGKPWTVSLAQSVRIVRDGALFRLIISPARVTSNLEQSGRRRLAAAYDAGVQAPLTVRLDAAGKFIDVEKLDEHWKAYIGRLEQTVRDLERDGKPVARGRAALAALKDADETTRIGLIAGDVGPLLQYCGRSVAPVAEAGGLVGDGVVSVAEQKDTTSISEDTRYRIDALTGLTRSVEHRVASKAQPDKPLVETWRFERIK